MNTSTPKHPSSEISATHRVLVGMLIATLLVPFSTIICAEDAFQLNVLFNPPSSQLKAEERGRVMIYDGLDEEVVDRVLDEQFDRIEHMMFTRIRHARPDGSYEFEDDGC